VRLLLAKLSTGVVLASSCFLAYADPLDGCVNFPENPTVILGLIGLAGAVTPWVGKQLRMRQQRKKQKQDHDQH